MTKTSQKFSGRMLAAFGGLAALTLAVAAPQPAAAQGLFGSLFGGYERDPFAHRRYDAPARSYAPTHRDRFPFPSFRSQPAPEQQQAAPVRSPTVHCVRLCDGRYFPLPRAGGNVRLDPAKVCSALCPAAPTKVFTGSDMQHARAGDGTRYASLNTAFAFRDRIVPDCSCTGQGPGGLAQIDVESDPTLRAGDIVVTADGPAVFRGSRQFPYQTADFTPVEDYGRLNRNLRSTLAELQVNTGVQPVVPPQRLEQSQPAQRTASTPRQQAASDADPEATAARRRAIQQRRAAAQQAARERAYYQQQRQAQQGPSLFRFW